MRTLQPGRELLLEVEFDLANKMLVFGHMISHGQSEASITWPLCSTAIRCLQFSDILSCSSKQLSD